MGKVICTANFNVNIEAPKLGDKSLEYDLNKVITTENFELDKFGYKLLSGNRVSISENFLTVYEGAYGSIIINVYTDNQEANAETELYGFYAKIYENAERLKKQNQITRKVYPQLLPKSNIDEKDADMGSLKIKYKALDRRIIEKLPK